MLSDLPLSLTPNPQDCPSLPSKLFSPPSSPPCQWLVWNPLSEALPLIPSTEVRNSVSKSQWLPLQLYPRLSTSMVWSRSRRCRPRFARELPKLVSLVVLARFDVTSRSVVDHVWIATSTVRHVSWPEELQDCEFTWHLGSSAFTLNGS